MQVTKLIGSSPLVSNYAYSCNFFNLNSIYAQSLRWKRKPIWLPTAKTKVFRVPVRPQLPEDEKRELQKLFNNYRTYLRSVRAHFKQVFVESQIQEDKAVIDKLEEEDFNRCFKINEEWNQQIAEVRAKKMEEAKETLYKSAEQVIKYHKEKEEKKLMEIEEKVKTVKAELPTFITRDNIDEAIEQALDNVINYNKALSSDGVWHAELPIIKTTTKKSEAIQIKQ